MFIEFNEAANVHDTGGLRHILHSLHRAVNSLSEKILNLASEVVILELVSAKCFSMLMFGLECCQLNEADLQSLDLLQIGCL